MPDEINITPGSEHRNKKPEQTHTREQEIEQSLLDAVLPYRHGEPLVPENNPRVEWLVVESRDMCLQLRLHELS